jgi:hypothetical protein
MPTGLSEAKFAAVLVKPKADRQLEKSLEYGIHER